MSGKVADFFGIEKILPQEKRLGHTPTTREIYGQYIKISFPSAMQGFFTDLMVTIDLLMVGALGTTALATVGIMGQPRMLMLVIVRALSVPITALVSRRRGEERYSEMNLVLKQGLVIAVILYLPVILSAFLFMKQFLILAGAEEELLAPAISYGRCIVVSVAFFVLSQIIGAALIGAGKTRQVFRANMIGNMSNTVLNYFLIYGVGIFPKLNVFGAGLATMIGSVITFVLILIYVCGRCDEINILSQGSWRISKKELKSFSDLGMSSLGEQIFERTGMFIFGRMIAKLGVVALATHYICINICDIFYSFGMGLGYAGASLTGHNLGKKRPDLAEAYGKVGIRTGIVLATLACIFYYVFRYQLANLFTDDAKVIQLSAGLMTVGAIANYPQTFQLVFTGVLKGAGDNRFVMKYSLWTIAVFRPILTYILCFTLKMGVLGAWLAMTADQTLRMIFSAARFYGEKWKTIKL